MKLLFFTLDKIGKGIRQAVGVQKKEVTYQVTETHQKVSG